LTDVGLLIEKHARDICPVDTGRLRSSIGHYEPEFLVKPNPESGPSDAHWVLGKNFVEVGTNVFYAKYVIARDPFMEAALSAAYKDVMDMIKDDVQYSALRAFGKGVKKTMRRIGRFFRRG